VPAIRRKLGKEPEAVYAVDTHSRVFFKEPQFVKHGKGKAYLTHRHFRRININKEYQELPG
jgi:hypothetical protein